jgi:hypothetical protein
VDYGNPNENGFFPIHPDEISLGDAVGRNVSGIVGSLFRKDQFPFEIIATFTDTFFTPFAVTFDYADMNLYVTGAPLGDA